MNPDEIARTISENIRFNNGILVEEEEMVRFPIRDVNFLDFDEMIGIAYFKDGAKLYIGNQRASLPDLLITPDGKRWRYWSDESIAKVVAADEHNQPLGLARNYANSPTSRKEIRSATKQCYYLSDVQGDIVPGTTEELVDFLKTAGNASNTSTIGAGMTDDEIKAILLVTSAEAAAAYALDIMKNRWPELENMLELEPVISFVGKSPPPKPQTQPEADALGDEDVWEEGDGLGTEGPRAQEYMAKYNLQSRLR